MSASARKPLDRLVALLGVALIIATGVVFAAHDGQDGSPEPQQAAGPPAAVDTVVISDFLFKPATITVAAGTRITFVNRDDAPHTATSDSSPKTDGVFDTGTLKKGQRKSVKVVEAGTFAYYCAFHPFMKATVIVT